VEARLIASLPDTYCSSWASGPSPPQGNHKGPHLPASATPALTMTPKPLRRPCRSHSKGGGGCGCEEGTLEVALAGDTLI